MTAAQVLLRKGKRAAAQYLRTECARAASPAILCEILDLLLSPVKSINEWDMIDWCRWLMAGGLTPDEFSSTVQRYDNATTCGLVWTANFVAYRCRTCGISPCMSLCADCFQKGNHQGHDFNMFRSQAGGACDCGDASVMKESGFCQRHGPQAQVEIPAAPSDLVCVSEAMMPRVFLRLLQHLRENSKPEALESYLQAIQEADGFLTMLHDLSSMGAAMRKIMTTVLTNPHLYEDLTGTAGNEYQQQNMQLYRDAVKSLASPEAPDEYRECSALQELIRHHTFLEELVFWTVKFEFPQKLVCLLLNMLPDADYKEAFTRGFVQHYSRISLMLAQSVDSEMLSNRVVHVSVQLFSNEALAVQMTMELHLLHVMVISLKCMMSKILIQNTLHDPEKNFHYVVNCANHIMKDHCYWPLVSDLNNVLSHRPVAVSFLDDDGLLEMWFAFLAMFQGMNVNQRELSQHVEFEPGTYYAAFSAELEGGASPMWALMSHLKDSTTLNLTQRALKHCLNALLDWFDAIAYVQSSVDPWADDKAHALQASFHLPLHRYFSILLSQAVKHQGAQLTDLLPSPDVLLLMMNHPMRVQVAFYEIMCGMWVRNGLQIKGQAMTYIQCHFCNSMVDADVFLLQLCASQLDPDLFLMAILDRFHVTEWLTFGPPSANTFLQADQVMPMLESCLTFLATVMSVRTNIGLSEDELTRLEMVTQLCMADRTHSQLMELMPEKCGTASQSRDFEAVLSQVADYRAPNFESSGNMQQGMYVPKNEVWEERYDPVYVLLRAVHRRDFQGSLDRFTSFVKSTGQYKGTSSPWPPFRIPETAHPSYPDPRCLLHSRTFYAVIFTLLHKAVFDPRISEQVMALTIYLLEMAVTFPEAPAETGKEVFHMASDPEEKPDQHFSDWFPTSWLTANLQRRVGRVLLSPNPVVSPSSSSSGDEMVIDSVELATVVSDMLMESSESTPSSVLVPLALPPPVPQHNTSTSQLVSIAPHPGHYLVPTATAPVTGASASTGRYLVPTTHAPGAGHYLVPSAPAAPLTGASTSTDHYLVPLSPAPVAGASASSVLLPGSPGGIGTELVPTGRDPEGSGDPGGGYDVRQVPAVHNLLESEEMPDDDARPRMKALPPSSRPRAEVNETIVSLLLKLHSKLSAKQDSYTPCNPDEADASCDSRIGGGPFFVGKLLDKMSRLDTSVGWCIQETRESIWPHRTEEAPTSIDREERRRKARERQQRLMAEFANRQKQFMKQAMETEASESGSFEGASSSVLDRRKEFDCVICNQTAPSTEARPIGLVVLLQATSVLGHQHQSDAHLVVPTTDDERRALAVRDSRAALAETRVQQLSSQFDKVSWLPAVNIGWQGGIHVQTCGHYLHLDCHKSYLQSLRNQQRTQNLAVERGEYSCPLCRQLANSVLPIFPDSDEASAVVKAPPNNHAAVAGEILTLLQEEPYAPTSSGLVQAMGRAMEDMTNATFPKYKYCGDDRPGPPNISQFVYSIARTNLELELVQRGCTLLHQTNTYPKRASLVPLLHVLAMHCKILSPLPSSPLWAHVAGLDPSRGDPLSAVTLYERDVPLLLRDITALLIQLVLTLPLKIDPAYFTCVVRCLYQALYIQNMAWLSCLLNDECRQYWKEQSRQLVGKPSQFKCVSSMLGYVIDLLEHCQLYLSDADCGDLDSRGGAQGHWSWSPEELDKRVREACLPFLRVAALLRHHVYDEPLPQMKTGEFGILVSYLGLLTESVDKASLDAAMCLHWPSDQKTELLVVRTWCEDLLGLVTRAQITTRNLLTQSYARWCPPRLLRLPHNYNTVFLYYHRRQCPQCNSVPKEPSVCLVCGAVVCLRGDCCRQTSLFEAVRHAIDCGAGTAMFLAVNSSTIIVIRGNRACLWGSVYLDSFGEEDRDLKRGKPLFLSEERYRLLEQQWVTHSFDHTSKRWIWHKDML